MKNNQRDPDGAAAIHRRTMLRWTAAGFIALPFPAPSGFAAGPAGPAFVSERLSVAPRGSRGPAGRDVLLIAGLASGPSIWLPLVQSVAGHRYHLVHIAGFAGKAAGANAKGELLAPLTNELARYIRHQRLNAPMIIGHSMGGALAMMLALRTDVKPGGVMVVDMLPEGAGMLGGTRDGLGYLAEQLNGYFTGTRAGRQLLAQMVRDTPSARDSDPQVIAQALTELARTDLTPRLGALTCPLSVVYAVSSDARLAAEQRRRYERAYAAARPRHLSAVGPAGHMVMLDQPRQFSGAVQTFLR
ncbi:MAG TPA: alpha/beta hydrolase [Sphingobium sp.]|nr:alpha/beta hydrolase [Sphingobium sp.]